MPGGETSSSYVFHWGRPAGGVRVDIVACCLAHLRGWWICWLRCWTGGSLGTQGWGFWWATWAAAGVKSLSPWTEHIQSLVIKGKRMNCFEQFCLQQAGNLFMHRLPETRWSLVPKRLFIFFFFLPVVQWLGERSGWRIITGQWTKQECVQSFVACGYGYVLYVHFIALFLFFFKSPPSHYHNNNEEISHLSPHICSATSISYSKKNAHKQASLLNRIRAGVWSQGDAAF